MNPFFSHLHAELRAARMTRRGATHKPEDVPRGTHKAYPRMIQVPLPAPAAIETTLADALRKRSSGLEANPAKPITLQELGTLLGLSLGKKPDSNSRHYPSGGALYPVETYLISTAIETQNPGVYHYDPTKHSLERLCDLPENFDMKLLAKHPEDLDLSTLIVFTSVWSRSSAKYGDLAYLHALLEAGHMSQNILLTGCALDLSVRPYAGFNDAPIAELLDITELEEQIVHTITLCKK